MSTHPRTQKKLKALGIKLDPNIKVLDPFNFSDFITLQKNSMAVLSDSGTITEESSILKFIALNLRESYERQEGAKEGSIFLTGLNESLILKTIDLIIDGHIDSYNYQEISDYQPDNVSKKFISILISYIDLINREVYKKI